MHQILTIPFEGPNDEISLIEQKSAPILFLSSASTDISTLSGALSENRFSKYKFLFKALTLNNLLHPAQIDHYLSTTANDSKIILVRLLGGRGHWSYGLEQLKYWQEEDKSRSVIILSGTEEEFTELHSLNKLNLNDSNLLAMLLIEGGIFNMTKLIEFLINLLINNEINTKNIRVDKSQDPYKWNWKTDYELKIGVIYYRSLFKSNDIDFPITLDNKLIENKISTRTLVVSSLKDKNVLDKVIKIFIKEKINLLITATSFACISSSESQENPFDKLNIPILQMLTSTNSKEYWIKNSRGLNSLDLTLQIVLPELDGRITTRPCAFRNFKNIDTNLESTIPKLTPYEEGINWLVQYSTKLIKLQKISNRDKIISIVLANYPIRNGRIANGVGLDTPNSLINIIKWLEESNYNLGTKKLPNTSNEIINLLLSKRTNDIESRYKVPLDYISLDKYLLWWNKLPSDVRQPIINKWGIPSKAQDLEDLGFPIIGVKFGNLSILIQPSRSYEKLNSSDIHSPDLPPPHAYLAQYIWIREINNSNLIINLGKHGTVEWLPGKGVGISNKCFPHLTLDSIPNIYPFIVNDPGEGSQAKRRTNSIIIDHLTPPLDRAELYGDLQTLEALLDEYYEASLINSERISFLEQSILKIVNDNNLIDKSQNNKSLDNDLINNIDSYLCELKESQIRTGLHIFGQVPEPKVMIKLLLCIIRCPTNSRSGITQELARLFELQLDPWIDDENQNLVKKDINILSMFLKNKALRIRHAIDWLEEQAYALLCFKFGVDNNDFNYDEFPRNIKDWAISTKGKNYLDKIDKEVWVNLNKSAIEEKKSLINSINGLRVKSGPSGAPSRGRPEVLPTGRNFYSVDLRGLPTEAAWDIGKRSAENILELYFQNNGQHLTHLALSVWGTSTMRNGGEDICQLLALLGVKPKWDGPTRRYVDLEIIPLSVLDRPRVDVTLRISGMFRDAFPNLVTCVYKAQSLIQNLDEPKELNPLAFSCREGGTKNRIYGSAPSSYGAGLQHLIDSGAWETKKDLSKAYIAWSKWAYNKNAEPVEDESGLNECLRNIKVVMHNQDNREHDIFDSDDYYQFHGGLSAAVENISGKTPEVYFGDNSRFNRPRVHKLEKEIDKVVRSRVLNPKWINGMKKHGYKGAFEMGATLDYIFAYDSTTNKVPGWCYSEICNTWLNDKETVSFLLQNNPWVLRDISERFLEASKRNLWKTITDEQKKMISQLILKSEYEIEKN